jgi:hypothetical protein
MSAPSLQFDVQTADGRRAGRHGAVGGPERATRRSRYPASLVGEPPPGDATVRFAGRLPSGTGDVVARYRAGGGAARSLDAGRLNPKS